MLVLLLFASAHIAHGAQLDVSIAKDSEEIEPTFQFTRIITISHDGNSELQHLVQDEKISFEIDAKNTPALISQINSELKEKSFAKVADVTGTYSAIVSSQEKSIGIEYRLVITPTIQNHFIGDSQTLDSQWRGFILETPIVVDSIYGEYDINSPSSVLKVHSPESLDYLQGTDAITVLETPLVDASGISEFSLSMWESMFDPTAKMSETETFGFTGSVITNYSMGICTVYLGLCEDDAVSESFAVGDEQYSVRSVESQDDATIVLEGYVSESKIGELEVFSIQDSAPSIGNENDLQVTAMYAMAGVGVAVAVGFFVISDRKTKSSGSEQTGIDPKHLESMPITSSAGRYQTYRATAQLKS
jgi:hypothetical protein